MATPEESIAILQELFDRGVQARLPPDQLAIFNELVSRGEITPPVEDQEMDTFQFFERTLGQQLIGTGEMLVTILSGALTEPVAGLAGITEGVAALVAGDEDPLLRASERVQRVRFAGTRTPRKPAGKEALQAIAAPIEALFSGLVQPAAEFVGDVTGSPLAATLVQTAAETFPPGFRPRPGMLARRAEGTRRIAQLEGSTGVPLQLPIFEQAQLIGGRAESLVQGQTFRAENFAQVQQSLIKARDITKANTTELYRIARETKATIPREFITILNDSISEVLIDIDITDFRGKVMPTRVNLNNRLLELQALVNSDKSPSVQLNELSAFRRRLNANKGADATERFALGEVKGVLDSFLEDMFNADMISGDPAAIQRWTDANSAFADFKKTFSDDKVIKKLTEQLTDPEQVKNWIMGTSAVGGKVQAGKIIDSIGDIIGKDSPQFDAIRQEVLFDILEPIMKTGEVNAADLQKYIVNYDKFVRNRMSLSRSIFPESLDALRDLRDLASSATNILTPAFQFKFSSTAARGLWGNALAKSAVRIGLLTQVFELMKSAGTTRARQISARILGYNLRAPVLPVRPLLAIGALQTLGDPAESEQQMLDRQIRAIR